MKATFWSSIPPRRRKLVVWILGLLLFYAILGFLILPPIVRAVAVKQLSRQLDREVSIQKIKINPFVLSTTVRGLLIKDKDGQPFISWDEVYVNFQLSSFLGHPWVFKEISVTKPYARVQINKDYTLNFSDLVAKFSTNAPAAAPATPPKPLALRVGRLQITGAAASFTDFTTREPFRRTIGPLNVTLQDFRTDPDNKNPYSFAGTTDAGERFAWSGFFYLDPLRSQGELTLDDLTLNKYAPLYQDFVRFEIRSGVIGVKSDYRFELSASNRVAAVTNTDFSLRNFRLGSAGDTNDIVDLTHFAVTGASVDLESRQAEVDSVSADGAELFVERDKDANINALEAAKPVENETNAPGGILLLLRSVTNAVAMLLNSTNQWNANVHDVNFTDCGLHLEDLVNSRPARLDLDDVTLTARNISNLPHTNLTADLSLRWNTNGTINTKITASLSPPTADIHLSLSNLDLGTLDPYLEPELNLFILGSRLGLDGDIRLRTPENELPQVTFTGDARLDDFRTVDGVTAQDLLKWDSLRFNGIEANLNPPTVAIKEIALDNAYTRVVIETNHTINLLTALRPAETNAPATTNAVRVAKNSTTTATNSAAPALPKISVDNIVVSNATISFTDLSLTPNVHLAVQQAGGTISGISSENLQHADVNLHAAVDGVGPVDITGRINPFSGTGTNHVQISVKDVDLTPTSPYAGKFAGYRIAMGKLNLDLVYDLVGKKLESKNVITLDQFTFGERVESPDATHLPVRLAIAILKDRDGKIVLDVPVEGSLDDPKFRIGKVVTYALVNILTKVATSPFSLIGAAFGGGGEELGYQDFAPGSAELTPADKQKLDTLVKALFARPGLNLEISGSIDPSADHDGLQRVILDKQLHTRKWLSLRKSQQATLTPEQVTLTPAERVDLVKKLYNEAWAKGQITPAMLAANTNLASAVAQIKSKTPRIQKDATFLVTGLPTSAQPTPGTVTATPSELKLSPIADPMEVLLVASIPVTDNDFEALVSERAKAVRAYLLASGKVEASRLFLAENQTGGVRSDGSRAYLQFR
ncbi:MAG TPA: DUF748 domain-containing protein [Candidatus Limnocylindrales bacterium]|nr:DUF748 domain-containing protein [Candidatus Limnocylindrales bacterium]